MSKLPINGRIIIVDDKIEQAKPLMTYFSQNKMPFTYFDGRVENLPEDGFDDIRIIFLDINLTDNTVPDHKSFRALQPIVDRLISKVSHPYLLVLWTRDPAVFNDFKTDFFKDSPLSEKCPIDILSLEKSKFFSYAGDALEGDISDLGQELCTKLDNYPELQSILSWESTVHKVTNDIASIFSPKFDTYENWSQETRKIFTQFAKASLGKYFIGATHSAKLNGAFEVIHQVFMDELETQFYKMEKSLILEETRESISPNYNVNTKLLIEMHAHIAIDYPGSLIQLNKQNSEKSKFFLEIIDQDKLYQIVETEHDSSVKEGEKRFSELSKNQILRKCSEYRKNHILPYLRIIQLRIDPLCDYVQKKIRHSKCVHGLLIPIVAYDLIDRRSEALYISPVFNYEEHSVALVIDFRTLHTMPTENPLAEVETTEYEKLFRIRSGLLADIQSKFSRHASRQGLLYL